eukprot:COSAG04_NODE_3116_length_3151_cov_1.533093_2_plen_396_part_00
MPAISLLTGVNNTANSFAVADVFHAAAAVEDWTQAEGTAVAADVAIVYSTFSEVWEPHSKPGDLSFGDVVFRASEGLWTEKQMMHAALTSYLQLPVDVITDAHVANASCLARYKLLYLVDPHLGSAAATALKAWVREGGVVWSQARAATRNELNDTADVVAALHGGEAAIELTAGPPEKYQEIGYPGNAVTDLPVLDTVTIDPTSRMGTGENRSFEALACIEDLRGFDQAHVAARFAGGGPALISFAAGSGTVWRLGTVLGAPMALTATPPFAPRPQEWRPSHTFDTFFASLYGLPLAGAKVARPVRIPPDQGGGIDARLFRNASGAALLLADYSGAEARVVDIEVEGAFRRAVTMAGQSLQVSDAGGAGSVVRAVPLTDIQAVFLSVAGGSDAA